MGQCAVCKLETEVFEGVNPICLQCSEVSAVTRNASTNSEEIRATLLQDMFDAIARNNVAAKRFDEAMGQFPGGLHPEGVAQIKRASNELSSARRDMAAANNRLNKYLSRGIVPEDLKRRN